MHVSNGAYWRAYTSLLLRQVTHHYDNAGVSIGHDAGGLLPTGEGRVISDDVLADGGQPQQHAVPSILIAHLQIEVVIVLRDKVRIEQDSGAPSLTTEY